MGKLEVDFKFHNVGQGLFYTGRLKYGRASFNFVYDCGSEKTSLVKGAIDQEFRHNNHVDLLVISHLHKDHISGVPYLSKKARINTVILPYLSPIERLAVTLQTPIAPREFYMFLADPIEFLIENGVKRIVLIGGSEPDRKENWLPPFERPPDLPPEVEDIRLSIEGLPDDERLISEISRHESISEYIQKGKLFVKNHSGTLLVLLGWLPLWVFRFFNYKISPNVLSQFENCVRRTLGNIDFKTIKQAILDRNKRKALKACYSQLVGGSRYLNNTSLLVVHRPAFRPLIIDSWCDCAWCPVCCPLYFEYYPCCPPFRRCIIEPSDFVQFLTGDVDLNYRFNEISQHFGLRTIVRKTIATLIPHHGSHNNWNNALCNTITSNFWVVSAGIRNTHGHPSPNVILDICRNCQYPCAVWVNEATPFRLMGILEF